MIDDEDDQEKEYRKVFGDRVVRFCKKEVAAQTDTADLSSDRRCIVFARNACFEIAQKMGYRYFLELDDDYTDFQLRFTSRGQSKLLIKSIRDLDLLFDKMIDFLNDSGAITVALGQGGDLIGGAKSKRYNDHIARKAMNTFFCDIQKPFCFRGRINEDVNTYVSLGNQGNLIFTFMDCIITQKQTQGNSGGMTETYLDFGTYLKSFYSVIFSPSAVTVAEMGDKHRRIHHRVEWNACAPLILNEKYRKRGDTDGRQTNERI